MKATWERVDKIEDKQKSTVADLKDGDWFTLADEYIPEPRLKTKDLVIYLSGASNPISVFEHLKVIPIKVHLQYEVL